MTVVAGPRQVGKTTMVIEAVASFPNHYVAAEQREPYPPPAVIDIREELTETTFDANWLVSQWRYARSETLRLQQAGRLGGGSPSAFVLVIDEIQKIPRWAEVVKGLWDSDRANRIPLHVVLLGSAPLLVQKGLSETLAGRFELLRLTHWSFTEMRSAFGVSLDEFIYFGGYPGSMPMIRNESRWREYIIGALVQPNIEKDILMMAPVKKPALLKRLFELGCRYSGRILSYNKMVGQLQDAGNTVTLAHYLDLLASAELIAGLQQYAGQTVRQRASSPKLNALNTSLITSSSGYSFAEALADRTFWGHLVESAAGAHLFNTLDSKCRLHYWRDSPHEADFVLSSGGKLLAIEICSGDSAGAMNGLEAFGKSFPISKFLLVGKGGVPLGEFLAQPASYWLSS